jgi:hypothetical protein
VLQKVRRRRVAILVVSILLLFGGAAALLYKRRAERAAGAPELDVSAKEEAPRDLQKLREPYTAGVDALGRDEGAEAVKHLSSFDFGARPVEEYRLYYLANAHQLEGNNDAARVTLARLWRRKPKMTYANDAAFNLASLYESAGDLANSAEVYAGIAGRADAQNLEATARWRAATARLQAGDVSGALYDARLLFIQAPATNEAKAASALVRALTGIPDTEPLPLTHSERLDRAMALMAGGKQQDAITELTAIQISAPSLKMAAQLQHGIALHQLKQYDASNKVLEPLTPGPYKYAIPALRYAAKNYATIAASINPDVFKTVKERKKAGTVKQRVGKGKKRRTVTRPKYQTVFRKVKLVDLAKKKKKDENERLASERLKDLMQLPIDDALRIETLNALIARAAAKNQGEYLQEIVPQLIELEPAADPALQYFWDRGWAAYARGDLGTAKPLFRFIADTYPHPNVRRQSEYWYARCVDRQGQKEEARALYQKLASAPYEDLYAQHAIARGAKRTEKRGNPLKREGPDWRELAEKEMPDELELAYELTALSSMREAFLEVRRNMRRENNRFAHAILADLYHASGNDLLMYGSLRKAWPQLATVEQDTAPLYFMKMYYPIRYSDEIEEHAKERGLDPNLVRGLILQESYYNPKAKSRVGATGLMQLMPPTATEHAKRLRIPFAVSRLENPKVNVQLGTYHLRMLINLFQGNVYLAVAAYNAGQGNVAKWRRASRGKPIDELLESIPFPETRNYVKRVTMLRSTYARIAG